MTRRLLSMMLLATAAGAQAPTSDLEQVWLDPSARGSLIVGNGQTLPQGKFRAGLSLFYTYGNFRTAQSTAVAPLLTDRLGAQVFGAVGLFDWLELGVNVPVMFYQRSGPELQVAGAGLGNPWVNLKAQLLGRNAPISLGIGAGIGIPVGMPTQAQTNIGLGTGLEVAPRVQLGKVFNAWQFGVEVGFLFRNTVDYGPVTFTPEAGQPGNLVGHQLWAGLFVSTVNQTGPRGEFSLRGFVPVGLPARAGIEAQLGVRVPVGPVEFFASAGPGFGGEPSTPLARVYLGVAFGNEPMVRPPCIEGEPYEPLDCPELDKDGDGVRNGEDQAPLDPEDRDGFQDEDGVPDPDNDQDGVLDVDDRCPNEAGVAENGGCPDVDTDGDGIVDRLDQAPTEPEDKDGFQDEDGVPDPDNDQDGILDVDDACPLEAGILRERGCPPKDDDGDGVPNHEDNCPQEAGVKENQGCPAAKKQLVVITEKKLQILDRVYFDTGRASIQKRSFGLLDNLANVLSAHGEIAQVQIEGHTDNTGNEAKNKALSQSRADSVREYLIKKGVAAERLTALGFGQENPAEPNTTAKGRDANRRVEFTIK